MSRPLNTAELVKYTVLQRSLDSDLDASLVIIDENCPRGGRTDFIRSTTILHPLDAISFLSTPFQVILENEVFDGAFLLWMAKALNFTKFIDAYRSGKFSFRHAGGKDSIERSAKAFLDGVWSRKDERYSRALRLWMCVVLDNDAKHDKDFPNQGIVKATEPHVAFVHQLNKRSIESYIPIDFLEKILKKRQIYALKALTIDQQRFYHMKKGFRFEKNESPTLTEYKSSKKISKQEKDLFTTIPQLAWQELRTGFGGGLSAVFIEEKYRPNANDIRLINIKDRQELASLLKKIYERF